MDNLENVLDGFETERKFQSKQFYWYTRIINTCIVLIGLTPCAIALMIGLFSPGDPMVGNFLRARHVVMLLVLIAAISVPAHIILHYINLKRAIAFSKTNDLITFLATLKRLRLGYSLVLAVVVIFAGFIGFVLFFGYDLRDQLHPIIADMGRNRGEFFMITGPIVGLVFLIGAAIILWTNREIKLKLKLKAL